SDLEALKEDEYLLKIPFRNSYTVIPHRKLPHPIKGTGGDMDCWCNPLLLEFHGVCKEVLQDLGHLGTVGLNDGERVVGDGGLGLRHLPMKGVQGILEDPLHVGRSKRSSSGPYPQVFLEISH